MEKNPEEKSPVEKKIAERSSAERSPAGNNPDENSSAENQTAEKHSSEATELLRECSQEHSPDYWMLVHTTRRILTILCLCGFSGIVVLAGTSVRIMAETVVYPQVQMEWKTEPYRSVDGTAYFNRDPVISVLAREQIHGLASLEVRNQGNILYENKEISRDQLTGEVQGELYIAASRPGEISLTASATSVAGVGQTAVLRGVVDQEPPVLELRYQSVVPGDGEYYSGSVEADLVITEDHFDPDGVRIMISGEYGSQAVISGWTSRDSGQYVCKIYFQADDTYRFSVSATDLAGNTAVLSKEDRFTIDQTVPVAEFSCVSEATQDAPGALLCRVTVTERNFDAGLIKLTVSSQGREWTPESWSRNGICYTQEFLLEEEGNYQILLEGTDQAGNQIREILAEALWVDYGKPEIRWNGVQNGAVYSSEQQVTLQVSDANLDPESLCITCESVKSGTFAPQIQIEQQENGKQLLCTLSGFGEMDGFSDRYVLKTEIRDRAGRISTGQLLFGINRSGSSFIGGNRSTRELLEAEQVLQWNCPEKLIFLEENLDPITEHRIMLLRDGQPVAQEGDLEIQEELQENGWYRYRITIPEEILQETGKYTLSFLSVDASGHYSSPGKRHTNLEFEIIENREIQEEDSESENSSLTDTEGVSDKEQAAEEEIREGENPGETHVEGLSADDNTQLPEKTPVRLQGIVWILLGILLLGVGFFITIRILRPLDTEPEQ